MAVEVGAVGGETDEIGTARGRLPSTANRLNRLIRTNWQFSVVALVAVLIRIIVILGYPPILWFNDSYVYLLDARVHMPDPARPNGYPFFLDLLLPLHSLTAIGIAQAAMGVTIGVAAYALLRHRGLPWWGAMLPALPVLFDSYQLHIEHMITADTLFTFLVTLALVMLCWNDRPSVTTVAFAGLMIGYATVVRSVGQPLLAVVVVGLLVRRVGWLRMLSLVLASVAPIVGYMIWFHGTTGKYTLTESGGTFLYSRVMTFAKCQQMGNLDKDLTVLCDPTPPQYRPPAEQYLWADNELGPYQKQWTPLHVITNSTDTASRFTPQIEGITQKFAEQAIITEPFAYLRVALSDTLHTFGWSRELDPQDNYANGNGPEFQFDTLPVLQTQVGIPWWAKNFTGDISAHETFMARKDFAGRGIGTTGVFAPWANIMQGYQRVIYMRGTLLAGIVLLGAIGIIARWRRWGGLALLPWLVGALLIVLPPLTAGFSYRYVLAAVPVASLAAGLAFARKPGERPVQELPALLRGKLGRGSRVEQE